MKGILNREKCLSHLRDEELIKTMTQLLNRWERAFYRKIREITDFYDPYTREVGEGILSGLSGMSFLAFGGFPEAERKRLAIFPEGDKVGTKDFNLSFLQAEGNFKFQKVNHRDFLGSLLGLGIERAKIGDIIVEDYGCQVVLDQDIASYVIMNWDKVNCVSVKVREISPEDVRVPQAKKKEIKSTVASPRLDAVSGTGFGLSRSKTLLDIKSGKVQVNWKTIIDPAYQIKAGDKISYRGKGRIIVDGISGPTQKGRYFIYISRYL